MSFWHERIKIGNLSVPRFIGGPLDGITDSPFRKLVRDYSKDELLYTEMRHVGCIANDKSGVKALKFEQLERPLNYQIAAADTTFLDKALDLILARGVDVIDLNVGCPAKNVIRSRSGSALMADPERLKVIVTAIRKKVSIPFTVKIRAGFKECNAVEIAKMLEGCGIDALAIHPRLQTQRFEGRPDYALVAEVKKAISIPVIVSGGIVNFKVAKMVHEQTGVDGFLIGRPIWARPWKLHELQQHALGNEFEIEKMQVLKYALKHLDELINYYGPHGLYIFRKHLPFYIRGLSDASSLRQELILSDCPNQVRQGLVAFFGA
ncbi:MAG TPA: tRNA-dihydrouridine synthase [Candidatus Babeliales bacterium]|nr:tRNA-dihydrouridine synthase [Candidatus Babeliales bacterium]